MRSLPLERPARCYARYEVTLASLRIRVWWAGMSETRRVKRRGISRVLRWARLSKCDPRHTVA